MPRQYIDTQTRRRQVADAALATLVADGVSGFTTRVVAAKVGISEGTLFRHFGNKAEIVLAAMDALEAELFASLVDTGDALADLEQMFRHRAHFVGAHGSVGRLVLSDQLVHLAGDPGRQKVLAWRAASLGFMSERVDRLRAEGRLKASLPTPSVTRLIQGSLLTFAMQAAMVGDGSADELEDRVSDAWAALDSVLFDQG